ncbi:hypothetical protein [Pectobacterium versatile]|uniref:hypothetical protein n=1 Tax=Pectobacterium versatile TaxID=2488639 RepID=UPI001CCE68A7|nr:hypothetical protein [Pectobacterium versatile]
MVLIKKNIPITRVNESVKIEFTFDTNGAPETKNARIEALVIPDGIITDMYHLSGSKFEQSSDEKSASVISTAEKSSGWGKDRYITLLFKSLPKGNDNYIVGTLYYYNADNVVGLGIPLIVKLND